MTGVGDLEYDCQYLMTRRNQDYNDLEYLLTRDWRMLLNDSADTL